MASDNERTRRAVQYGFYHTHVMTFFVGDILRLLLKPHCNLRAMHKWLHLNFDHEREVINETSTEISNVDSDRESHTCTTQQYVLTQG
jgi:hypothetical protein